MKYIKGPWTLHTDKDHHMFVLAGPPHRRTPIAALVPFLEYSKEELLGNGRLLSNAPSLLWSCLRALNALNLDNPLEAHSILKATIEALEI